ncbi:hypothetical protein EAE96_002743 [Botrytis aclada]|nr:hypothetical protein EAE96_002743 [Botrytis aclada]
MPAVTRSKSPCKKAPADPNQASSAAKTPTNVAPVANMQSPGKKAQANSEQKPAGVSKALSDAMVPALAPLSPSKKKRGAKTLSDDEGVGKQPTEPMKRTRVERSDAPRSRPTSGQTDLAATTYPQVERVILGLENTPVFGTTGGAPKEGVNAEPSTPAFSPKSVETTAAAPVLVGEENGAEAEAPISAVSVTAGQVDDETVVEQPSPHPAADLANPLAADEAEVHLPAAPQGCSPSDLEVAKEEIGSPKIGITKKCKCDKLAAYKEKNAALNADLDRVDAHYKKLAEAKARESEADFKKQAEVIIAQSQAAFQEQYDEIVLENRALKRNLEKARRENEALKRNAENDRREYLKIYDQSNALLELNRQLRRENDQLAHQNRELDDYVKDYRTAIDTFNTLLPLPTADQADLEKTNKLLWTERNRNAAPAQGISHGNRDREEYAQGSRSRSDRCRAPSPPNNGNNNYVVDNTLYDDDDSLPPPEAPARGVTGTHQSEESSGFDEFRKSSQWQCLHDRGFNGNTCAFCGVHVLAEGHPEFDRDRSVAPDVAPEDESTLDHSAEKERERESASYEPAEAVINTQDEPQQVGSPALPENVDREASNVKIEPQEDGSPTLSGYEDLENSNVKVEPQEDGSPALSGYENLDNLSQQDRQESPVPATVVEETTSDSLPPSSPSPSPSSSSSKKRKESPVSESSPAKKVKSTETESAVRSTLVPKDFKWSPAHPGWGTPGVLSPQVAVTASAPSTPFSASVSTTPVSSFPTVFTRSGAAVQFGAPSTFGAIGTARSPVRFGSTSSFGVPSFLGRSPSVAGSPKEEDAAENKPADQKK